MNEEEVEEAISILCDDEPQPTSNLEKFGCISIILFMLVFWTVVILAFIGGCSE